MNVIELAFEYKHILVPLVLVVVGGARSYRRTGTLDLKSLPWRAIERVLLALRRSFFTVKKPDTATINRPIGEVREALLENHFEDGWILSYRYHGEDANLRRPAGKQDGLNRQTHVRLWDNGDGTTGVVAHEEASPLQHPGAHIREKDLVARTQQIAAAYSRGDSE